jgi:hypothetical protein
MCSSSSNLSHSIMPLIIIIINNLSLHLGRLTMGGMEEENCTIMRRGQPEEEGGLEAVAVLMERSVLRGVASRTITPPEGEEVGGVGEAVEAVEAVGGGALMTVGVIPTTKGR